MKKFVEISLANGFDLWYDRSIRLWTLTKEGCTTEYIPSSCFKTISVDKFVSIYLKENNHE